MSLKWRSHRALPSMETPGCLVIALRLISKLLPMASGPSQICCVPINLLSPICLHALCLPVTLSLVLLNYHLG